MATAQAARGVDRKVLEGWINMEGEDFEAFVREVCQWTIEGGDRVVIPVNNDNEAKTTVTRENVKFDRKFLLGLKGDFEKVIGLLMAICLQNFQDWSSEHTSNQRRGKAFIICMLSEIPQLTPPSPPPPISVFKRIFLMGVHRHLMNATCLRDQLRTPTLMKQRFVDGWE